LLIGRVWAVIAPALAACAAAQPPTAPMSTFEPAQDIRYISTDLGSVLVFSRRGTRFGDLNALFPGLWPSHRAELIEPEDGVRCLLIGPRESGVELAIKRPIRTGDHYRCIRSSFRVTRCFNDCQAAIVEVEAPASGNDSTRSPLKHSMYVDRCLGMLAYSVVGDMEHGMSLGAMWLRGRVGVLADPRQSGCEGPDGPTGWPDP
jgi:hypothetical protein